MVDNTPVGIQGRAAKAGTQDRNDLRASIKKVCRVFVMLALVVGSIHMGSHLAEYIQGDGEETTSSSSPVTTATSCSGTEKVVIKTTEWHPVYESPPCDWEWERSGAGGILEVRINKDNGSIRNFPIGGAPHYDRSQRFGILEFRLKDSTQEPTVVMVHFVMPK